MDSFSRSAYAEVTFYPKLCFWMGLAAVAINGLALTLDIYHPDAFVLRWALIGFSSLPAGMGLLTAFAYFVRRSRNLLKSRFADRLAILSILLCLAALGVGAVALLGVDTLASWWGSAEPGRAGG